jgi:hypothetical protein
LITPSHPALPWPAGSSGAPTSTTRTRRAGSSATPKELKKGEWSFAPPKAGADPENGMIYSADVGMGKVAGIKFDHATGAMKGR